MGHNNFSHAIMIAVIAISLTIGINGCSANVPEPTTKAEDIVTTSSVYENHKHTVTINAANIDNPPEALTLSTTKDKNSSFHTHKITLTKKQFELLKEGKEVRVTTIPLVIDNHYHAFTIKKP